MWSAMAEILSFLAVALIVRNNPELFTEQIAGIVMVFYIGKTKQLLHEKKTNILRPSLKMN